MHDWNALSPTWVILGGSLIDLREVHPQNAARSILFSVSGSSIEVRCLQRRNVSGPIVSIPGGTVAVLIDVFGSLTPVNNVLSLSLDSACPMLKAVDCDHVSVCSR